MDELSLFSISNGKHYSNDNESDEEENEQPLDVIQQQQQQPLQNERGGRRKGVPRRLQLSPEIIKPPTQRLLPLTLIKSSSTSVHHHEQPILTSDQEDENDIEDIYHQNQIEQNYLQLNLLSKHFVDNNNNNNHYNCHDENEDILEIVDDILADIVTIIVKDIKEQRRKVINKTNGHLNHKQQMNGIKKIPNGKHNSNGLSKSQSSMPSSSSKLSNRSKILNDLTKTTPLNSQQTLVKHKLSPSSSSSFSSPPTTKRQKTSETSSQSSTSLSIQQQLLWEMTQQLMMSSSSNETDSLAAVNSSLLKQQLLGLTQSDAIPKRTNRPSKPEVQSSGMSSNATIVPHTSTSPSPFERGNFAPRRRGRPPKYVTDRGLAGLSALDLDPSSLTSPYDQLFAAIENGMSANAGASSAAAFQSALASMLGQQTGLSMPPAPVPRNGAPASMVKNTAGQSRHSLPASSMSSATKLPLDVGVGGMDMPLMAAKKRGPGRPPKTQMLFDPHQILQATQRLNSPTNNNNNFPPTMVPSSPNSFDLNAAFVEMLQQQQQQH
ncbi:unnamed protein product [Rotaria sp. Silwood2]|nr:unnamed protein product [Rotaria sp. Silwood2]CAF2762051.1 unnamed protein product [Rotaria sp. Silwood2]CAF2994125.1 unnamed protein product [Rotaria sp. Silwood2]CAF3146315.1 unnamed protein product [Rotaria sp. Silwood2]CAF4164522.1 unnamed protein product [Rotaria sp. Silwood2]